MTEIRGLSVTTCQVTLSKTPVIVNDKVSENEQIDILRSWIMIYIL